jgi:hypothetical protein
MKLKNILALNLLLSLGVAVGCGSSGNSSNPTPGSASIAGQANAKDLTDYGQCNSGPSANRIAGSWQQTFQIGEITFVATIDVGSGQTTITNDCMMAGRTLRASTSSPSSYTSSQLTVFTNNQDHEEINETDFHMNCDVSIKPMAVSYSFQGSCLVMTDPSTSQKMIWLPKR